MESITQLSLHDELLSRLRRMIIDGQFAPGDKIPERQLCDQFGVSRTPLREALKVLAAEGLVQLAPNRGAMIVAMSPDELEEILSISAAIETLSGELACKNVTDAEIEEIRALHAGMTADYEARNFDAYFSKNRQIHQAIVSATHNGILASIHDTLFFRIGRCRAPISEKALKRAFMDHQEIMAAIEARDGDRLAGLLKRHFENLFEDYRSALRNAQKAQAGAA
jgi:DNA-binding GntR family transcriptional regulator